MAVELMMMVRASEVDAGHKKDHNNNVEETQVVVVHIDKRGDKSRLVLGAWKLDNYIAVSKQHFGHDTGTGIKR